MKKALLILGSLTTVVFAGPPRATPVSDDPKPGAYDYDLFLKDKKVLFVNAELLYWVVDEGALDYAIKMKNPSWGPTTDAVGHFKRAEFNWDPGFRGSFGYFNAPSYWDVYLQYTYYKGTGKDKAHAPEESNLLLNGTWPEPDPTGNTSLASAHSDIKFRVDLLELLVTRRFNPNYHLRMRLYGGVDVVWLRQNWAIDYVDTLDEKSHLRNQWRFNGAGLRLGYIVDWYMHTHGLYLTGAISVAGFAGGYRNISRQTSTFSQGYNPLLPLRNAHYHDTRLISHIQVLAGPSWQQAFKNYRAEVFLGYEFNMWTNLQEAYRALVVSPTTPKQTIMNSGLIGIQGVTLRANLDF